MDCKRLCLWSGPRNVSTALMYAFAQRADTRVFDEPLYGHYLRTTGVLHPGADDVLAAMDCNGPRVIREVILGPAERPVHFYKHMAHHLVDLKRDFMAQCINIVLTREPRAMLPSLTRVYPEAGLADTGYAVLREIVSDTLDRGEVPLVLDSRELLNDPRGVLSELCRRAGLAMDEAMLSWPAGPRPEDGVWAPHWYENVHRSTGFAPYTPPSGELPDALRPLLAECQPYYDFVAQHTIRAGAP